MTTPEALLGSNNVIGLNCTGSLNFLEFYNILILVGHMIARR